MGLSVVPLVYMMVHRSSGWGGFAGEGFCDPNCSKASKLNTLMPRDSVSCSSEGSQHRCKVGLQAGLDLVCNAESNSHACSAGCLPSGLFMLTAQLELMWARDCRPFQHGLNALTWLKACASARCSECCKEREGLETCMEIWSGCPQ